MKELSFSIDQTTEGKEVAEQPLEVEISSEKTKVNVCPEVGGMVTRFSIDGKEILYFDQEVLGKEALSGKRKPKLGVPFLFPFSGPDIPNKEVRQHGGVREVPWVWEDQTESSTEVSLSRKNIQNGALLGEFDTKYGPEMDFDNHIQVSVENGAMEYKMAMKNIGQTDLPLKPGLHPYFRVNADKQGEIETNLGNFDFASQPWKGESLKAERPKEGDAWFTLPGVGKVTIQSSPEFKSFIIWSQRKDGDPEAKKENYICLEPWTNTPDEESEIVLSPGEEKELFVRFIVEPE